MLQRSLSVADMGYLESYSLKCEQVKQQTLACVMGVQTGLLLFGSGGNGKSYCIREMLATRNIREITPEDINAAEGAEDNEGDEGEGSAPTFGHDTWILHQGRVTPKGLVKKMNLFPKSLHLVEDAETMFDSKDAWGVLRMALASQDKGRHSKRHITWTTSVKEGSFNFHFTGSIIIVGNRLLPQDNAEVNAVKTRAPCLQFNVSNDELLARMKQICEAGYKGLGTYLPKSDCYDVLDFITETISCDPRLKVQQLNLRILFSGFNALIFSKLERSADWKSMILSQLKEEVKQHRSRDDRMAEEKAIAAEISQTKWASQHDKILEWCKRTGRSMEWANYPKTSDEYKKGFLTAKTDYQRKSK